ncbi:MAG TPA: hypothetical protein VLA22_01260 [Gaiellaceae bacterium]|nr:hypothetical protein [Gaiellaceae bacterium]
MEGDVRGNASHVHELVATLHGAGDMLDTAPGGSRIVDMLVGEPHPRIC